MAGLLQNDAIAAYHFAVEIDSTTIAQFQEVSGITSEIETIQLKENTKGGLPVIKLLPGAHKPPTITLKRGKTDSKDLWEWHDQVVKGQMSNARRNGSIILFDYEHGEVSRYNFHNAWVSKISVSALKAGANEVAVEECSIVCESLERVS